MIRGRRVWMGDSELQGQVVGRQGLWRENGGQGVVQDLLLLHLTWGRHEAVEVAYEHLYDGARGYGRQERAFLGTLSLYNFGGHSQPFSGGGLDLSFSMEAWSCE